MRVVLGSDTEGMSLKEVVKAFLIAGGHDVVDKSNVAAEDFVDSALAVANDLMAHPESLGFAFDAYGIGSCISATHVKGMIVANISDERSASMTRKHNGAQLVTLGANICGPELACNIAQAFLTTSYAGGRHQIRVDMLNKMA